MLVLSRKLQQQIQIGPDITITVLRVKGSSVRLGIEAPQSRRIVRAELQPFGFADESSEKVAEPETQSQSSIDDNSASTNKVATIADEAAGGLKRRVAGRMTPR